MTDELNMKAFQGIPSLDDLNATILRLLGLVHEHLTYVRHGVQRRLSNVEGAVIAPLLLDSDQGSSERVLCQWPPLSRR